MAQSWEVSKNREKTQFILMSLPIKTQFILGREVVKLTVKKVTCLQMVKKTKTKTRQKKDTFVQ